MKYQFNKNLVGKHQSIYYIFAIDIPKQNYSHINIAKNENYIKKSEKKEWII